MKTSSHTDYGICVCVFERVCLFLIHYGFECYFLYGIWQISKIWVIFSVYTPWYYLNTETLHEFNREIIESAAFSLRTIHIRLLWDALFPFYQELGIGKNKQNKTISIHTDVEVDQTIEEIKQHNAQAVWLWLQWILPRNNWTNVHRTTNHFHLGCAL